MKARWKSGWRLLFFLALFSSRPIAAQVISSCPATVSSPRDLRVQLALHHDQTVFRQGEIIDLEIRYTSQSRGKYLLNNRSYDRSGRLEGLDLVCLRPDPGTDPLDDYFHSYAGFMGGGLFSEQQIGAEPLTTDVELNEWRSLPPGVYSLSIQSERVSVGKEGNSKSWNNPPVPVQSNRLDFQIVDAEPSWQSSALSDAVRVLDSSSSTPVEKEHAARVLRFLNSENACRELVRRFWGSREGNLRWEFEAGLFGTPFRQAAISEMRAVLRDSRDATRTWFIDVLVDLELQSDPRFRQLRYGTQVANHEKSPSSSYEAEHKRRVTEYASQVAAGSFR